MGSYYIDYENVAYSGLVGCTNLSKRDKLFIFCRDEQIPHIQAHLDKLSILATISFITVKGNCPNALDFQLITYLTLHINRRTVSYIISKDTGYDAAIDMLKDEGYLVFRMHSLSNGIEPLVLEKKTYSVPASKKKHKPNSVYDKFSQNFTQQH